MPITTQIDFSRDLTIFFIDGLMLFDEMQNAIKRFFKEKDSQPTRNILWDLRSANADQIRSEKIEELATFTSDIDDRQEIGKSALVAPSDLIYGLAKIFEAYIDNPSIQVQVFRDIDKANKWIEEG